jgi:tetratricopeptide (TPR) repeat protein
MSCGNLANSLKTRYKRTGNDRLLGEAIELEREALALRPEGDLDRATSCGNLASSLWTRYLRTGDILLLNEAIELERGVLALRPVGHPDRAMSCGSLAISLKSHYNRTDDARLLDEAIELQREALALHPAGHPDHASSCGNLANSLKTRFRRSGDTQLVDLDEIVELEREAFALRSGGDPDRPMSCINLANSLGSKYGRTGDEDSLKEMFLLLRKTKATAPTRIWWRQYCQLSWGHLQQTSTIFYDVKQAVHCLSKSLEHEPDDFPRAVSTIVAGINAVWNHNLENQRTELITIYQRLVNLFPFLANTALDLQPQLQALRKCRRVGSDAFVNAALAGKVISGLETLELAQGVIWSQSLHRRDPQLQDIPNDLATRLEAILQAIAAGSAAQIDGQGQTALTPHDILHSQSSQAYALIEEIRALPGLECFMLGETFETLRTVASTHPVVVLVSAHKHFFALIITASQLQGYLLLSLDLTKEDLKSISFTVGSARACRVAVSPEDSDVERGMNKTKQTRHGPLDRQLITLWHKVVKPVLESLGFEVSEYTSTRVRSILTSTAAIAR